MVQPLSLETPSDPYKLVVHMAPGTPSAELQEVFDQVLRVLTTHREPHYWRIAIFIHDDLDHVTGLYQPPRR